MKNRALKNYYYETIQLVAFEDLNEGEIAQMESSQGFRDYKRKVFSYRLFGYAFTGMVIVVILMAIATLI